jgi:hypothetical protein
MAKTYKGYCLEIDGEICPAWFTTKYKILKEEAMGLLPPHNTAKIRKVTVKISRRKAKKK